MFQKRIKRSRSIHYRGDLRLAPQVNCRPKTGWLEINGSNAISIPCSTRVFDKKMLYLFGI